MLRSRTVRTAGDGMTDAVVIGMTTLIIIVLVVFLLGGGGFYFRGRGR